MNPAVLLAVTAAAGFGIALVLTQAGLRHLAPLQGARVSVLTTTSLLWLLSPWLLDLGAWRLPAVAVFAAVGCLFPAAVTVLTFAANRRLGPTLAGTLGGTAPLFALAAAALLLGERISIRVLLGTVAVLLGVAALSTARQEGSRRWSRRALLLPLSAAAIRGVAQPLTKYGLGLWPQPFAAGLIGYTVSSLALLAAVASFGPRQEVPRSLRGIAWFALVGVCNGAAVLTLYTALGRGRVGVVAPIVATYPLFTLAVSAALPGHERLTARALAGVFATVGGVVMIVLA